MDFLEFQKEPEELEKLAKVVSFGIFPLTGLHIFIIIA